MMKIKLWLQELRAPFFTASIIPVLLGTAIAWSETGTMRWLYFVLALLGGVLLHAGANVSNDYFDHKSKNDEVNTDYIRPFTGGSRMIQKGLMTPREVLTESFVCYFLALCIGIFLYIKLGTVILWLGLIGAFSGFFYTAPPFRIVARGLGEIIIALNFGVLLTLGAYFVQTGTLSWIPVVVSLPIALLVAGILYINEFPDYRADKEVGKDHLVVRLGRKSAAYGYFGIIICTYAIMGLGIAVGIIPAWALVALLTIPIAIKATQVVWIHYDEPAAIAPASVATIQLHLFIGLILSATYIIRGFF